MWGLWFVGVKFGSETVTVIRVVAYQLERKNKSELIGFSYLNTPIICSTCCTLAYNIQLKLSQKVKWDVFVK